jgi:hypothetical protein
MSQTNLLVDILQSLKLLVGAGGPAADAMQHVLGDWRTFFDTKGAPTADGTDTSAWLALFDEIIARPDRQRELALLELIKAHPFIGLSAVLAAVPIILWNTPGKILRTALLKQEQSGDLGDWRLKDLPAPSEAAGRKYLIFSDVHRDAKSDNVGQFKFGSINHFSKNSKLYLRILQEADADGYTVLEGGDCEELWFIRSVDDYPKTAELTLDVGAKLAEIIRDNAMVYAQLRKMHRKHRYYRIQGNHDSYVKPAGTDTTVGDLIRAEMERLDEPTDPVVPFAIYDGCVIQGVKTMQEYTGFDILGDLARYYLGTQVANAPGSITADELGLRLIKGHIGLDAQPYTEKRPMLVCHGHQFDFWNCPENEILGMIIANTVGTFADRAMDPLIDLRGFALQGNPIVDFGSVLSSVPVFDSWPDKQSAIAFAHHIQHMPNSERVLNDSPMFIESLPALIGGVFIALTGVDDNGAPITPAASRATLNMLDPRDVAKYLGRHHFNHICLGHTHAPHSQPFFTLANLGTLVPLLLPLTTALRIVLPNALEPQIKSRYFNTGTVGWMEGVIWAVEIDMSGQARLVYWTENSRDKEYMDWELQTLDPAVRAAIPAAIADILGMPSQAIEQRADEVLAKIKERLADFNVSAKAVGGALEKAVTVPIHLLALAMMTTAADFAEKGKMVRQTILKEVRSAEKQTRKAIDDGVEELQRELDSLRSFTVDFLLTLKRRTFSGFLNETERETMVLLAPISDAAKAKLEIFHQIFKAMPATGRHALRHAALAFSIFDDFPRNMPFFSSMAEPLDSAARLLSAEAPVLQAFLSTLWLYPIEVTEFDGVDVETMFSVSGHHVTLRVSFSRHVAVPQTFPNS